MNLENECPKQGNALQDESYSAHQNKKRKDILPLFFCFKGGAKAQCLRVFAKDLFEATKMSLLMIFEKIPLTAPK